MTNHFRRRAVAAVVAFSSFAGCGIKQTNSTESTLTIKGDSREVKAVIDGPASITSTGNAPDTATVSFDGRQLVVEQDRVLLDVKEQAKLPANAKKVQVEIKDRKLTITADGTPIELVGPN